jgi:hypothetical protein
MEFEPVIIIISREEVEAGNIEPALITLKQIVASPDTARSYLEKADIAFHGYDNDTRELYEITEVRNYVYKLDEEFPFWLFFLSKKLSDLQTLLLCFMPPYLTEEAKAEIFSTKIGELLERRLFPALNYMCAYAGIDEEEIEYLTEKTFRYISSGPLRV